MTPYPELDERDDDAIARVNVPLRTVSELNTHSHWRDRQKRAKAQKELVMIHLLARIGTLHRPKLPIGVRLIRSGPGKLDSDNLQGSLKYVRDAVADFLGCDDGDEAKVHWSYGQEKGPYLVSIIFHRWQP